MIRRAFFIASVLGAISAAGALAFAPELTRVGRALTVRAGRLSRGFTPVPADRVERMHRSIGTVTPPGSDSLEGKYCRFPPNGEGARKNGAEVPPLSTGAESDSSASLALDGQSALPQSTGGEAICAGESSTIPRRGGIP